MSFFFNVLTQKPKSFGSSFRPPTIVYHGMNFIRNWASFSASSCPPTGNSRDEKDKTPLSYDYG